MKFHPVVAVVLSVLVVFSVNAESKNPREFWGPRGTKLGKVLGADQLPDLVKTPQEIDKYLQCHLTTKESKIAYKDYKLKYGPFTEWASHTFDLPQSLSTCLMYRESTFKNVAKSDKGALGILQMMPKTYQEIRDDLFENVNNYEQDKKSEDILSKINFNEITPEMNKDQYEDNDFIRCYQFTQRDGPYYFQATAEERKKGEDDCNDFFAKYEYRTKMMHNYGMYFVHSRSKLKTAADTSLYKKYFPNSQTSADVSVKDKYPPENIDAGINNPMMVVGMQMYHLKEMLLRMDNRVDLNKVQGGDPVGYLVLMAGGYNAGINSLLESTESGNSVEAWCRNLVAKGGEETKNYMLSIRRCLTKSDYTAPTGQDSRCADDSNRMPKMEDPCVTARPPARPKGLGKPDPAVDSSLRPQPRPEGLNVEK